MKSILLKAIVLSATLLAPAARAATPDWLITSKAKLGLYTSQLGSKDVHVDTNAGVVTLFGKVPSEDLRSFAEAQVKELEGVRSVVNRLEVAPAAEAKPAQVPDKKLKQQVEQAFGKEPSLKDSGLTVKGVDKGVVTLAGQARNYSDQLTAIAAAEEVPGVRQVRSEVKSPTGPTDEERLILRGAIDDQLWGPGMPRAGAGTPPPRQKARDLRLTGAVKLGLFSNSQIPVGDLSVDTRNGVVTLFGEVPSEEAKTAASAEASRVAGDRVQNLLKVVPAAQEPPGVSDEELSRDVELALREFPGVASAVRNGIAQLRGYVPSGWAELDAVRAARQVKGVRGITNLLKIEPGEPAPLREPGT